MKKIVSSNCKISKKNIKKKYQKKISKADIVILSFAGNLFRDVFEVKEDVECDKIPDEVAFCTFPVQGRVPFSCNFFSSQVFCSYGLVVTFSSYVGDL